MTDEQDAPATGDGSTGARLPDLARLGRLFGKVVAPASLVTGLLFYLGWSFTYWYFFELGVNSTLLGSTTEDYLMRSIDALFVPVTAAAAAWLLVVWVRAVVPDRVSTPLWDRLEPHRVEVGFALGSLLLLVAVGAVVSETLRSNLFLVAPLSLIFGVLLIAYAVHTVRGRRPTPAPPRGAEGVDWTALAEWAAVFVLVATGLFWAVTDYASAVGTLRARELARGLTDEPHAVVYSERSLGLSGTGVTETRCSGKDPTYRFRYDGLVLVLESGGQYLFLPRDWVRKRDPALVVPESDAVRMDFAWGAAPDPSRPC